MNSTAKSLIISAVLITLGLIAYLGASAYKASRVSALVAASATPTPDPGAKAAGGPQFTGLDNLIDYGLSNTQLQDITLAFNRYFAAAGKHLTSVTVDGNSIKHVVNAGSPSYYTFTGKYDGQEEFQAKVLFTGLTDDRLILMDGTGKQVYDSGSIDLYNHPQS